MKAYNDPEAKPLSEWGAKPDAMREADTDLMVRFVPQAECDNEVEMAESNANDTIGTDPQQDKLQGESQKWPAKDTRK